MRHLKFIQAENEFSEHKFYILHPEKKIFFLMKLALERGSMHKKLEIITTNNQTCQ